MAHGYDSTYLSSLQDLRYFGSYDMRLLQDDEPKEKPREKPKPPKPKPKRDTEIIKVNHERPQHNIWVIFEEGNVDEYVTFLHEVRKEYPNKSLKFSPYLWTTLDNGSPDDVYILNSVRHEIKTTGALENGGILKGSFPDQSAILTSQSRDVMLNLRGKLTVLENLTLEAQSVQCAIMLHEGHLELRNCKMTGDDTNQAIIVHAGATLDIINSEITRFETGVVGNTGASVSVQSSKVHDVCCGFKIYANCALRLEKSCIGKCRDHGICVETDSSLDGDQSKTGDFELIAVTPKVILETYKNIGLKKTNPETALKRKSKLKPVLDHYGKPNMDNVPLCDSVSYLFDDV